VPSYPSGFYVYLLVDPRTGVPFYCGKGQRGRAWQHAIVVVRGDLSGNSRKVAKIQEILMRGGDVEIQIVAEYELENDALEHEFELVDSMPELTNIMPGGGLGGRRLTQEEITLRAKARADRIAARRAIKRARFSAKQKAAREAYVLLAQSAGQVVQVNEWLGPANQPL